MTIGKVYYSAISVSHFIKVTTSDLPMETSLTHGTILFIPMHGEKKIVGKSIYWRGECFMKVKQI